MPNSYRGVEDIAEQITVPADTDGPHIKAADVNPAFEALKDGSNLFDGRMRRTRNSTFGPARDIGLTKTSVAVFNEKEQAFYINAGNGAAVNDWAVAWADGDFELLGASLGDLLNTC